MDKMNEAFFDMESYRRIQKYSNIPIRNIVSMKQHAFIPPESTCTFMI